MISTQQLHLMGTMIDIVVEGPHAKGLTQLASQRLREYEHRFSANDPSSELGEVNRQAGIKPVKVAPELYHLIEVGQAHSVAAGSHLNIAIGPLVQTWHIGFADARVPTSPEIAAKLQLIDPTKILLMPKTSSVYLTEAGMQIDLGALAKGYIADLVVAELRQLGAENGLLNLGGNVLTFGKGPHEDGLWRIGIRDPQGSVETLAQLLKLADHSVVTSGIYERKLQQDGHSYHHIFDSRTGQPIATEIASLTIISEDSLSGEIWTTRLFGSPVAEILQTIDQQPDIEGLVILQDGSQHFSKDFRRFLA